jgi:Uma2 family endonuclease
MGEPKRPRATYQDVLDAPEHMIAEIFDGELVLSPRPAWLHQSVSYQLGRALGNRFGRDGEPGGWVFLGEPELHLGDDVLVPDIAGWRQERLDGTSPAQPYIAVPPDWICEMLSKSTEKYDRTDKLRIYAAQGVGHVWLMHPVRRTLEVMRRNDRHWVQIAMLRDVDTVRAEPFDAIEIDVVKLWMDVKGWPPGGRASEADAQYELDL